MTRRITRAWLEGDGDWETDEFITLGDLTKLMVEKYGALLGYGYREMYGKVKTMCYRHLRLKIYIATDGGNKPLKCVKAQYIEAVEHRIEQVAASKGLLDGPYTTEVQAAYQMLAEQKDPATKRVRQQVLDPKSILEDTQGPAV